MKKIVCAFILMTLNISGFSQTDCFCRYFGDDKLQKPDTIIKFNGVETFAICGYFEHDFISEFTVTKCGEKKFLDFYGATLNYKIQVDGDTLKLIDYRNLLSKDLVKFEIIPWAIDMYYQSEGKTIHQRKVIYLKDSVVAFTKDFQKEWDNEIKTDWSDNERLLAWTFLISLNDKGIYKKYFKNYCSIFKIGGEFAEYYNELNRMYAEYNR